MSNIAAPLNGPVFINGFFGDAIFRTGQGISTISKRLCDGLDVQQKVVSGKEVLYVYPLIRLGDNGYEFKFPMRIYEKATPSLSLYYVAEADGPTPGPFEVIFGNDFLFLGDTLCGIDVRSNTVTSQLFGTIRSGCMTPFSLKSFRITNYKWDIDGRIILLFDMDCFEVQVHELPHQRGKPRVVVNSSDRILAVSYEAKKLGINRQSTPYLRQAMAIYPNLIAIYVPVRQQATNQARPRPDTSIAREATARIVKAIKNCIPEGSIFQFSSGDEFYVDITAYVNKKQNEAALLHQMDGLWPNTFLYNGPVKGEPTPEYIRPRLQTLMNKSTLSALERQEVRLLFGSCVASAVVKEILNQTGYQSSVGVGSKKLISKIASGMHKPGSISILAPSGLNKFSTYVKMEDIPGLGGKIGTEIKDEFGVATMADLQKVPYSQLVQFLGEDKKATRFLNSAFGIDDESVEPTDFYKTSGTTRQLYGEQYTIGEIKTILREQIDESSEKLEYEMRENSRVPTKIKMTININNGDNLHSLIVLENGETLPSRENLFRRFTQNCNPQFSDWNNNCSVESLQIVGHF